MVAQINGLVKRDERIAEFCSLVNRGIDAWVAAGKLLCAITKDNPEAYDLILSDAPFLTRDVLESFERIGRKEIYPYLLVDGSPGAKKLAGLPYDNQVKFYRGRVTVVRKCAAGLEQRHKRVGELTSSEASLVFDVDRIRTVAEQSRILRNHLHSSNPHNRSLQPNGTKPESTLDEKPLDELQRILGEANESLLSARSALMQVKAESRFNELISTALRCVGELRYAARENEL